LSTLFFYSALVQLIEDWTSKKATKKAVKEKLDQVQKIANKIDKAWHAAYAAGEYESLSKEAFDLTNQPLIAIDVVLSAGAVVANPAAAWSNVNEVISKCIEAETLVENGLEQKKTVAWMTRCLEKIVNEGEI